MLLNPDAKSHYSQGLPSVWRSKARRSRRSHRLTPPVKKMAQSVKLISSPVPEPWYPTLAVLMLAVGLIVTASFFIYEATSSKKNRSLAKELTTGAVASVFLGFGSLFLLLACGIYV